MRSASYWCTVKAGAHVPGQAGSGVHLCDEMRRAIEPDAARFELANGECDIGASEVDDRTPARFLITRGLFQQQANSRAIEEAQIAEAKELAKSHRLAEELLRAIDVAHRQRDLPYVTQIQKAWSFQLDGD